MRKWINLISEQIVQDHNTKRTVVAINPTRAEWVNMFPNGAAGVMLRDGRILVGDGNLLDHSSIMDYADIPHRMELCRLQMHSSRGLFAELWIPDELEESSEEEIISALETDLNMTLGELEDKIKKAVRPFMGDVPVEVIPIYYNLNFLLPYQEIFRDELFNA